MKNNKAEERAMEVYPIQMEYCPERDLNEDARAFFQEGYEQAEKDLGWISVKDRLPEEGFATVNLADGDYDDGLRVHESTKSVHVSYRDVKDLKQRLGGRTE